MTKKRKKQASAEKSPVTTMKEDVSLALRPELLNSLKLVGVNIPLPPEDELAPCPQVYAAPNDFAIREKEKSPGGEKPSGQSFKVKKTSPAYFLYSPGAIMSP